MEEKGWEWVGAAQEVECRKTWPDDGDWVSKVYGWQVQMCETRLWIKGEDAAVRKEITKLRRRMAKTRSEWKAFAEHYEDADIEFLQEEIEFLQELARLEQDMEELELDEATAD
jgi:hypothetical protein